MGCWRSHRNLEERSGEIQSIGNTQEPINETELSAQMQAWKAFLP